MTPPDIQPLIDIAKQIGIGFGNFFINLFLGIWNALPGLPNDLKGVLIGLILLALLIRVLKSPTARYNIQDLINKIANILTK
jgi:formate hydrogenlyase subunit 4